MDCCVLNDGNFHDGPWVSGFSRFLIEEENYYHTTTVSGTN